jgi:hypothetical protein
MAPKGKSKPNPRGQYFTAIKQNGAGKSADTLRWCLKYGGMTLRTEDEDGHTGIQIAAANGYQASLEEMIMHGTKTKTIHEDIEEPDEDGRTPLMMASYNGKLECVRLLVLEGKAKLGSKCEAGKTARTYAESRKHDKIVAFLDNPTAPEEEDEDEEDEAEMQKKKFMAAQRTAGQATVAQHQQEVHKQRVEAAEALEKALASSAPPVWPEVEPVLKETRRELSIRGKPALAASRGGPVDPAVWNCVCLFELRLELAERALTALPPQLSRLSDLVTLIVSGNALASLPEELGQLTKLRNLEAAGNELTELPASASALTGLQVVDVSSNKLKSLAPLSQLTALVAVNAGNNALPDLPLSWPKLEHMQTLAAPHNQISTMPPGLGSLQQLVTLDLAENKIEQVCQPSTHVLRPARPL